MQQRTETSLMRNQDQDLDSVDQLTTIRTFPPPCGQSASPHQCLMERRSLVQFQKEPFWGTGGSGVLL